MNNSASTGASRWRAGLPALAVALFLLAPSTGAFGLSLQAEVDAMLEAGKFTQARNSLTRRLAPASAGDRREIEFELARLDRIILDYPFTEVALFQALQRSVRELTWDEFQGWIREGRFDCRQIDGARRFMVSSVSNLFFRNPEFRSRRVRTDDQGAYERRLVRSCERIRAAAHRESRPWVLPRRFVVRMSVIVAPDAAPPGALTRVWLPIPQTLSHQEGFRLLDSSSAVRHLDGESSPIRSLLLEQTALEHRKNVFEIRYAYTSRGVYFDLDAARVTGEVSDESRPCLKEEEHVVFTAEIRELANQIAGGQTNSMLAAKSFYDWISTNIQYSYATEYSTIRNISQHCLRNRYGDCGHQALLFITLCRLRGIPARWQSGWSTFPGAQTMHDWTEVYLAPYGWVPVDPYMGGYAAQYADTLSETERKNVSDFYFGGLDHYRVTVNRGHSQQLRPPKLSPRSDTVDFQRGEAEFIPVARATPLSGAQNIYFDRYTYTLSIKPVRLKP